MSQLLTTQEVQFSSSVKTVKNPYLQIESLPKIYRPSSPSFTADKWREDGVKNIKISIKIPDQETRNTIKQWFGTSRYVYNKGVACLKTKIISFYELRNKLVNYKANKENGSGINPEIKEWEIKTPKVIREGGLNDLCKGLKECLKRIEEGTLDHFDLRFKSKKEKKASIVINKKAPTLTNTGVILFKQLLPVTLQLSKGTRKNGLVSTKN